MATVSAPRTVEEHRTVVAALIPSMPAEEVPLAQARTRVLAADVTAAVALPGFDNSAMDGYAVRAADVAAASTAPVTLPVATDIPAGRTDVPPLEPGTAARIMTGAPLPEGADAVVQVELTAPGVQEGHPQGRPGREGGLADLGWVRIDTAVDAGTHVRHAGEDVRAGDVVLLAGTVLGPAQIGVAAAVGAARVPVRRRPVVLVLSTGSELVAPGEPLAPGQIYESNGPMLAAAVEEAGGVARLLRFVPDDVGRFLAVVRDHLDGVDLVLTSGGVSAGAYEVVKDALSTRGVEFGKVAMQPGGPQGAGRFDGVGVVTLPGNPVSAQVSFEVFVRPALRAALGHPHAERPVVTAALGGPLTSPPGRRQYRRGVVDAREGRVHEVGSPASHMLAALARAECLFVVPEDTTALSAGSPVQVLLLDG